MSDQNESMVENGHNIVFEFSRRHAVEFLLPCYGLRHEDFAILSTVFMAVWLRIVFMHWLATLYFGFGFFAALYES